MRGHTRGPRIIYLRLSNPRDRYSLMSYAQGMGRVSKQAGEQALAKSAKSRLMHLACSPPVWKIGFPWKSSVFMWPDPGAHKLSPPDKSGAENYIRRIHQWGGLGRKLHLPGLIMRKLKSTDRPWFWDHAQLYLKLVHLCVLPFDFPTKPEYAALKLCNLRAAACSIIMRCNQRQKVAE